MAAPAPTVVVATADEPATSATAAMAVGSKRKMKHWYESLIDGFAETVNGKRITLRGNQPTSARDSDSPIRTQVGVDGVYNDEFTIVLKQHRIRSAFESDREAKKGFYKLLPTTLAAFTDYVNKVIRKKVSSNRNLPDPWEYRGTATQTQTPPDTFAQTSGYYVLPPAGARNLMPELSDMKDLTAAYEQGYEIMRLDKIKATQTTPERYAAAILEPSSEHDSRLTEAQRFDIRMNAEDVARGGFTPEAVAKLAKKILETRREAKKSKRTGAMKGKVRSRAQDLAWIRKMGPTKGKKVTVTV